MRTTFFRFSLAVLALLISGSSQAADWQLISKSTERAMYFDRSTLSTNNAGLLRVWTMTEFTSLQTIADSNGKPATYSSSKDLFDVNCDAREFRFVFVSWYNNTTLVTSTHNPGKEFDVVIPGTYSESFFNTVCAAKGLATGQKSVSP